MRSNAIWDYTSIAFSLNFFLVQGLRMSGNFRIFAEKAEVMSGGVGGCR